MSQASRRATRSVTSIIPSGLPAASSTGSSLILRSDISRTAVESLLGQTHAPVEILVIDNRPEESVAASLSDYPAQVKVIDPGSNIGYAPALGRKAVWQQVDTSDEQQVDAAVARAVSELGSLDILVAAAGLSHPDYRLGEAPGSKLAKAQSLGVAIVDEAGLRKLGEP